MNNRQSATIFVDNLPEQIRKIWLYNLFSKYGKIREIFIPNKKSKISGRNFGFVRFIQIEDAEKAVAEINYSWYWGLKLRVNFARFQRKVDDQSPIMFFNQDGSNRLEHWKQNPQYNQGYGYSSNNPHLLPKEKEVFNQQSLHTKQGINNNRKSLAVDRGKEVWRRKGFAESSKQGEMRNDQVNTEKIANPHKGTITVQPIGNVWLCRSAIAKIKRLITTEDLEYIFKREGAQKVQIKPIGGRYVVIIFPDEATRDLVIKEKWISSWVEEIKQWNGDQAKEERYVWLSCYGMPLHAWSYSTFKDIGNLWGQFLQVDDTTLKETSFVKAKILIATDQLDKLEGSMDIVVDNVNYSVKVVEEETFRFIKQSFFNIPTDLALEKFVTVEEEDDNSDLIREKLADVEAKHWTHSDVGDDEMVFSKVNQEEEGVQINYENVADSDSLNTSLGAENSIMGKEMVLDSFGGLSMNEQPIINTPNHLEFQEADVSNGGNLNTEDSKEVVIEDLDSKEVVIEDLEHNDNAIIEEELNHDHFEANQLPIQAAIKGIKGKSKRKNINEILGYSKVDKGTIKGRRSKNKCVLLRSAVASAALSASISSGGINNRNRILLDEAKAIWEVDKLFGISYDGDEREVVSKIAEMEALNKARADCQL